MISRENYFEPHIRELQNSSKGDPGLIERTLYAFGLLEALRRVGMEFIFKGGTSLLLLLSRPKRLCLLTGVPFDRNADLEGLRSESLTQDDLKTMKAFRKLRTGDYGYLVLADRLLQEYRKGR